ncbi:hypothetical protein SJAV_01400 [Sulfurisphaera javensis]|uniref:Glycosyltransferase n=1 Tax=Sulfurisphaera javensis TaxID=2049879 RepID=A0AAT9GN01_9CREN
MVCFLLKADPFNSTTGTAKWTVEVAKSIPNSEIIYFKDWKTKNPKKLSSIALYSIDTITVKIGKSYVYLPIMTKNSIKGILKIIRCKKIYLVDVPNIVFFILIYPLFLHKNVIVGLHGFIQRRNNFSSLLFYFLTKNFYFHALNPYDKEILIKRGIPENKIYLIPNFVYYDNVNITVDNVFSVLFIGRLEKYQKGIDFIPEIIRRVKEYAKDIEFVIIGDGPDKEIIEKLDVKYLGKVSEERKIQELQKADLLIFPSRFETFGLVLLEAQAFGLPVIAWNIPTNSFIIRDPIQGKLIEPWKICDFSNAILSYYEIFKKSKEEYIELKKKIHSKIIEFFGKEKIINELSKILE